MPTEASISLDTETGRTIKMRKRGPKTAEFKKSETSQLKTVDEAPSQTKRAVLLLCSIYIAVPVLLYLSPWILGHVIYLHLLRIPLFTDLTNPSEALNHTTNFYLSPEEGISVGVWHTLPASHWEQAEGRGPGWQRESLGDGHPVIIYLHGNVGHRALNHRVNLVKILSKAGYHVLSLDYRGFGDSSGEPSEAGMTSDALYLYHWVKQRSGSSVVCLWGHSLGTGVATNTALMEQLGGSRVDAVILEAPFTNIRQVIEHYPVTMMYLFIPGFRSFLWKIIEINNFVFPNDKNLESLTSPLLLLHSEDDSVVPFHMGQQLHQIALQAQRARGEEGQVHMVSYPASLGYSHNYIYLDPSLPTVVGGFLQTVKK